MTEPFPSRPRYMHRRTYQHLKRQYEAAIEQYVGAAMPSHHRATPFAPAPTAG